MDYHTIRDIFYRINIYIVDYHTCIDNKVHVLYICLFLVAQASFFYYFLLFSMVM